MEPIQELTIQQLGADRFATDLKDAKVRAAANIAARKADIAAELSRLDKRLAEIEAATTYDELNSYPRASLGSSAECRSY